MPTKRYISLNVVHPKVQGYIIGWQSNQLTVPIPQWPQIRVTPEQEVVVGIDPYGADFGIPSDTRPETVQVCAIIETDSGSRELLPFPPFKWEES